jgi:formiminoglutamase
MTHSYQPTADHVWDGRVDDPADPDAFRWHQVVQLIDLTSPDIKPLPQGQMGFCFLGFCCDEGVRRNKGRIGAAKAPLSIRKEMANLACHFHQRAALFDAGDICCIDSNLERAQDELAASVSRIYSLGLFPIILGGGHEIAFGHYKGIIESLLYPAGEKSIGIINFDAHFDLRPFQSGGSSGSPFLQIADYCREKSLGFSYFCLGLQTYGNTRSLFKTADVLGVEYILAKDIDEKKLSPIYRKLKKYIKRHHHIYLSICADVFSSAFAPGVSAPQPFGLHPEVVLKLVKYVIQSGKVVSVDIAEVSPRFDEDNQTAKLAAIIIYAIINTIIGRFNNV